MYLFVHDKVRNRLGVKKAEDLVYIYIRPFSEESDPDIEPVDAEEDSNNGGDDGSEDGDGFGRDGGYGSLEVTLSNNYHTAICAHKFLTGRTMTGNQ